MAKGYPDFFGQSIFLTYGPFTRSNNAETFSSAGSHTILTISAKGMIYGGHVYCSGNIDPSADYWIIDIDGITTENLKMYTLLVYGMFRGARAPLVVTYYNTTGSLYSLNVGMNITFSESFTVKYRTFDALERSAGAYIYYGEVI